MSELLLETYLKTLHLPMFLQHYQGLAGEAAQAQLSYERYLLALAEQEIAQRERDAPMRRLPRCNTLSVTSSTTCTSTQPSSCRRVTIETDWLDLSDSARNTIGGMPTPPPTSSVRGRSGCAMKPWPIGPSTLIVAPTGCCGRPVEWLI